jgi:hypothetical protein
MKNTVFWEVMPCGLVEVHRGLAGEVVPPSSGSKSKPNKERAKSKQQQDSSSVLKMEAVLPPKGK